MLHPELRHPEQTPRDPLNITQKLSQHDLLLLLLLNSLKHKLLLRRHLQGEWGIMLRNHKLLQRVHHRSWMTTPTTSTNHKPTIPNSHAIHVHVSTTATLWCRVSRDRRRRRSILLEVVVVVRHCITIDLKQKIK